MRRYVSDADRSKAQGGGSLAPSQPEPLTPEAGLPYSATVRLLVIGGTLFLGRHIVERARERGHELTLFNRGLSAPELFAELEQIRGDRDGDLSLLAERSWDAVIDTSGSLPRTVGASAALLSHTAGHYTFVSSVSAYGTFPRRGIDEDEPVAKLPEPESEDTGRYYGELKAACEVEVRAAFPGRALVVRPGLIVGPYDLTERFTYWVRRLAEGGRVLAPRAPDQPVQLIDARDLADWIVRMVEQQRAGTFNASGPAAPLVFGEMLERIRIAAGGHAELVWVDERRLVEAGVGPWDELPLWLDLPRNPEFTGFLAVDLGRALSTGLGLRLLEETVVDTLAWVRTRGGIPLKAPAVPIPPPGLSPEREAELLQNPFGTP